MSELREPLPGGHPGPQQEPPELPGAAGRRPSRPRRQPAVRRRGDGLPRAGRATRGRGGLPGRRLRDLPGLGVDDDRGGEGQDPGGGPGAAAQLPDPADRGRRGSADPEQLGKLAVFSGVKEYPMRVKCATLAWHTLNAALEHARRKSHDRELRVNEDPTMEEQQTKNPIKLDEPPAEADAPRRRRRPRRRRPPGRPRRRGIGASSGLEDGLRPGDPGQHLRARADLRHRGRRPATPPASTRWRSR